MPPAALTGKGPYKANIKLIAGMIPINLVDAIKDVGFDYFMSPREVADAVREGHIILWEREVTFDVHSSASQPLGQRLEGTRGSDASKAVVVEAES